MSGPDRTQPVPTPPHFSAVCVVCRRALNSRTEPIHPGPEPWTYTCATDAPKETDDPAQ